MVEAIDIAFLVGRLLFGGFFLMSGLTHITGREQMVPYAESKGIPAPTLAVVGSGVLLLVGGASVVFGILPTVGLAALVVFLVVVTPSMHDFWNAEDPNEQMTEQTQFLKNAALLGAAVALATVATPWALSVGV